ncbi:hypothetical protein C1701_16710 [Actinoalloteichus sp. AHMU CJ021]|uniref:DUF3558 family protein n=1 Tax=Actinoalloteichus sp. AHMU CJ021 TaxID=2072503 RepID=UPI000CA02DD8|nr:hypothetical protein C1701_16710 [Actinoalloteichus sp. AHMU CJ021]
MVVPHRRKFGLALLTPSILLVAACSSAETGGSEGANIEPSELAPTNSATAIEDGDSSSQSALQISTPLDLSDIAPCDLLSDEAARATGFDPESKDLRANVTDPTADGEICLLSGIEDEYSGVTVSAMPELSISTAYETASGYAVSEHRTVGDYPALHANKVEDPARCPLFVGVAENQVLFVDANIREVEDVCLHATDVAQAIIDDLPHASQE